MRKYYLFMIQSDYYKMYQAKPESLYAILQTLYQLKEPNFTYGISLFDSICQSFSIKLLTNYIKNKYTCTMKSEKVIQIHSISEKTFVQVNHACIVIKSNVNFPEVLKMFHIYNKRIFVCDFINNDYFWLSTQIQKRR